MKFHMIFIRKRLSILVSSSDKTKTKTKSFIVTKGALYNILEICSYAQMPDGKTVLIDILMP